MANTRVREYVCIIIHVWTYAESHFELSRSYNRRVGYRYP